MIPADRRAALGSLESASRQARRLGAAHDAEESAADIIELWAATETALRSLLGGAPFSGRDLIAEVRRRELIGIGVAHALIDFHSAREHVGRSSYTPTPADADAARRGYEQLRESLSVTPAVSFAAPETAAGGAAVGGEPGGAQSPPVAGADMDADRTGRRRRFITLALVGAAVVIAAIALTAVLLFRPGEPPPELAQGVEAYRGGRAAEAMTHFARAALRNPELATPHLWMARIHRERRDFASALRHLQRAAELEPDRSDVHRELGSYFLAQGRNDLALRRYSRAVELDPADRAAMGYLGCALFRLGRPGDAQRWFERAGQGPWTACLQAPPVQAAPR